LAAAVAAAVEMLDLIVVELMEVLAVVLAVGCKYRTSHSLVLETIL
jgi:hypothetical protein